MDSYYCGTIDFTTLIDATFNQDVFAEVNVNAQEPKVDHNYFDFINYEWYPAQDVFAPAYPLFPGPPLDVNLSLFPLPSTTPEQSAIHIYPHVPSPSLPFEGLLATQPLADTQQAPLPTPPVPVVQLTLQDIKQFDYCPHTKDGKVCGFVSWTPSGYKTVERHLKDKHFTPGTDAMAWRCPNPMCRRKGRLFKRKDALGAHRKKTCDPWHTNRDPDYIPQSDTELGNDDGVKGWIVAGRKQRNSIKEKLRAGTPWSLDLLQPTYL